MMGFSHFNNYNIAFAIHKTASNAVSKETFGIGSLLFALITKYYNWHKHYTRFTFILRNNYDDKLSSACKSSL